MDRLIFTRNQIETLGQRLLAKVSKSFYFPLSDDWRKVGNRSVDHSTRVLALLRQFSGE
jgi:hypothetical protein